MVIEVVIINIQALNGMQVVSMEQIGIATMIKHTMKVKILYIYLMEKNGIMKLTMKMEIMIS